MTGAERLYAAMAALGIPGTRLAYPEGQAPSPPFFVYEMDEPGLLFADNAPCAAIPRYRVQLLERYGDPELQKRVFEALADEFGAVSYSEDWSESEHCSITSYYLNALDD